MRSHGVAPCHSVLQPRHDACSNSTMPISITCSRTCYTYADPSQSSNSHVSEEEQVDRRALIELEVELYRQEGMFVPSNITEIQWLELLDLQTRNSRKKYLRFLFKNEMATINSKEKKEKKRILREEKKRIR